MSAADNAAHTVQGQLRLSAAEVKTTAAQRRLEPETRKSGSSLGGCHQLQDQAERPSRDYQANRWFVLLADPPSPPRPYFVLAAQEA